MLTLTSFGDRRSAALLFEQARIAEAVRDGAKSVAEVAVLLSIPVGVSQVICGDMVGDDLLEAHQASTDMSADVSLITRLIHGVRAL